MSSLRGYSRALAAIGDRALLMNSLMAVRSPKYDRTGFALSVLYSSSAGSYAASGAAWRVGVAVRVG